MQRLGKTTLPPASPGGRTVTVHPESPELWPSNTTPGCRCPRNPRCARERGVRPENGRPRHRLRLTRAHSRVAGRPRTPATGTQSAPLRHLAERHARAPQRRPDPRRGGPVGNRLRVAQPPPERHGPARHAAGLHGTQQRVVRPARRRLGSGRGNSRRAGRPRAERARRRQDQLRVHLRGVCRRRRQPPGDRGLPRARGTIGAPGQPGRALRLTRNGQDASAPRPRLPGAGPGQAGGLPQRR